MSWQARALNYFFKCSLAVNFHVAKPEVLALSKIWASSFCLSEGAHMIMTSGQSAWWIRIYNFRCLKWFFSKLPQKLWSTFLLKLKFFKMLFLVRDWSAYWELKQSTMMARMVTLTRKCTKFTVMSLMLLTTRQRICNVIIEHCLLVFRYPFT